MPDILGQLSMLGRDDDVRGAVDPRWSKRDIPTARVQSSLDVVLSFLDAARPGTEIDTSTVRGLARAMFDELGAGRKLRDSLIPDPGDPPDRLDPRDPRGPLDPPLGGRFTSIDDFLGSGCLHDVMNGLAKLGGVVQTVPRARPKAGAVISSIEPTAAAVGQEVTIHGSGFGDPQPGDAAVYVDDQRATVVHWSDTAVTFAVPAAASGDVCVSVLEGVDVESGSLGEAMVLAVEVGSTMLGCFGISRVGERLASGTAALLSPHAECGSTNHLWVGAPAIDSFLVNDSSTSADIRPGDVAELRWRTRFADQVLLQSVVLSGTPPASLRLPNSQVAVNDVRRFGPPATRAPWRIEYVLTASNAAGTRTRSVQATGTFGHAIAFLGAGTRSVFHAGALEYLPVAFPTSPRAVSSTGLGALAALSAATSFSNPSALLATWSGIETAPLPPPQNAAAFSIVNRIASEDPTVRQAFEAYEQGLYRRLLDAVDVMVNETMLAYADAPSVGDLPIAITDDETIIEQKVIEGLMAAGMWLAKNVVGDALERGGVSDGEMGKLTAPAKALVEEAIVGDLVSGVINGTATALMAIQPAIAVVFIIVADVVKGVVEGAIDVGKANALRAALAARGLYGRGPLTAMIDDFVVRSGLQGRTVGTSTGVALAASVMETGEPAYVDGFATARTAGGGTIGALGWRDALLAVTAVPGAMPPITIGSINVIDASFSDAGPLEILQRRDVDEIVVVHATCNLLPRATGADNFSTVGFLSLARRGQRMRSASLELTGVEPDIYWQDAIAAQDPGRRRWTTRHVMPTIALANLYAFEHEPGLLAIWRDYGYLRAFDVMAPTLVHPGEDDASEGLRRTFRDALAELSDLITGARESAWRLEQRINRVRPVEAGPIDRRNPPTTVLVNVPDDLVSLRQLKLTIRGLVQRRLELVRTVEHTYRSAVSSWPGDAVPRSRFQSWFADYERHGYAFDNITPVDPTGAGRVTPWRETLGFTGGGTVPAAPAPTFDLTLLTPLP
jgi:hypothetical protein